MMMAEFTVPEYSLWSCLFTGFGSVIMWGRWGHTGRLRPFMMSRLLELAGARGRLLHMLEFFAFVGLGVFLGVGLAAPSNVQQAIAVGMGWVGMLGEIEIEPPVSIVEGGRYEYSSV